MTLEELVYARLLQNEKMKDSMAEYDKKPAVFLQRAPDDTSPGWGKEQYPRAEYTVDMTADPERHSSGVVSVHIYSSESGKPPEDIAPAVRDALCDIVIQADDGTYCITWDRTELFELEERVSSVGPNTFVNGCSLSFLLIAFPAQATKAPDPALSMQAFLKELEPDAIVINKDDFGSFYEPSSQCPAFYVRISTYRTDRQTYALTWMDCTVSIHVIAPTPESRSGWARYLADCLNMAGEVTMPDGSPMLVSEVTVDNAADYLTRGQVSVKAQYAVTNFRENAYPLKQAYFTQKKER
jgi:hypothetical protein